MSTAVATFGLSASDAPARAGTVSLSYTAIGGPGRLVLTGAMTYVVDMAMLPTAGCRGLLVQLEPLDDAGSAITAPVTLTWVSNSVTKSEQLTATGAQSGVFLLASPAATHGVTALSLVSTANAVLHVIALG